MQPRRAYHLGRLAGLELYATPSALLSSLILWMVFHQAGRRIAKWSPGIAAGQGLAAVSLHWVASELGHHLGHALMARRSGYPMHGVLFVSIVGFSLYPPDEPILPESVHIRRALGGPLVNAALAMLGMLLVTRAPRGSMSHRLGWLLGVENMLACTFTLTPFDVEFKGERYVSDGAIVLRWWRARQADRAVLP